MGSVVGQVGQVESLEDDSLAAEGSIAVQEDRHDLEKIQIKLFSDLIAFLEMLKIAELKSRTFLPSPSPL